MAPVRSYTNWNSRSTDNVEQREPYRKYFFICDGANTETWYFRKLIDIRKSLNIHPLIDIRLLEKTEEDKDISFPRKLIAFAKSQKENEEMGVKDMVTSPGILDSVPPKAASTRFAGYKTTNAVSLSQRKLTFYHRKMKGYKLRFVEK